MANRIFFIIITGNKFFVRFNLFKEKLFMSSIISSSPIRRIFEEAFNLGKLAVIDEVTSPNLFAHNVIAGTPNGPQGLKLLVSMFRTAFPDLRCIVEDEIVEGDKFAVRWSIHGTHRGMFLGNPPTGKQVDVLGILFGRTENGRIIEDWTLTDQLGILQQLGIVPPSGRRER
jgi:predicted ester cyclase